MSMSSAGTSLLSSMPSTASLLSAYTNFAAYAMLFRTVLIEIQRTLNQIIPQIIQEKVLSKIVNLLGSSSSPSRITLIFEENGSRPYGEHNQMYDACELFLRTKIPPSCEKLKVFRAPQHKKLSITMPEGEKAVDVFEGIEVEWEVVPRKKEGNEDRVRSIKLRFPKENRDTILSSYLPYVAKKSEALIRKNMVLKLSSNGPGGWNQSITLDHPSTFETLAMDSKLKQDLIHDLARFVKRKDYYRKVGRAWKRGYLLYGPPGTGKSSLVAAMANYLKFHVYDLELTGVFSNLCLRSLLISTMNRSIIVIEDIDCSSKLQEDQEGKLTLSGLLNVIDGLWTSCGDERIIVFTTNHKERLDPALLRPGRMDMHIHMSYCTPCGFKTLASNYLGVSNHTLFADIERLITQVQVTPAQVAEEIMKSEEADLALKGLLAFLERLKTAQNEGGGGDQEANDKGNQPVATKKSSLISR